MGIILFILWNMQLFKSNFIYFGVPPSIFLKYFVSSTLICLLSGNLTYVLHAIYKHLHIPIPYYAYLESLAQVMFNHVGDTYTYIHWYLYSQHSESQFRSFYAGISSYDNVLCNTASSNPVMPNT